MHRTLRCEERGECGVALQVTTQARRREKSDGASNSFSVPGAHDDYNDDEKGYVHPSGSLLVVTEKRDESNLVSGYEFKMAYSATGWVQAKGDFVQLDEAEVLTGN